MFHVQGSSRYMTCSFYYMGLTHEEVKIVAYLALYRAYRPQKFEEVVGQEKRLLLLKMPYLKTGRLMLIFWLVPGEQARLV